MTEENHTIHIPQKRLEQAMDAVRIIRMMDPGNLFRQTVASGISPLEAAAAVILCIDEPFPRLDAMEVLLPNFGAPEWIRGLAEAVGIHPASLARVWGTEAAGQLEEMGLGACKIWIERGGNTLHIRNEAFEELPRGLIAKRIVIEHCPNLAGFGAGLAAFHLILKGPSAVSELPEDLAVRELELSRLPGLKELRIPAGVESLELIECPNFTGETTCPDSSMGSMDLILDRCESIRHFKIPAGIRSLAIRSCWNLESIRGETNLQHLELVDLPKLQALEGAFLATKTTRLEGCPCLAWEAWKKVAPSTVLGPRSLKHPVRSDSGGESEARIGNPESVVPKRGK